MCVQCLLENFTIELFSDFATEINIPQNIIIVCSVLPILECVVCAAVWKGLATTSGRKEGDK